MPYSAFPQNQSSIERERDPRELAQLVRDVVRNEIDNELYDNSLCCFREQRQEEGKRERTFEVCQTQDGDVERLIAVNGREITEEQIEAEDQRVQKLISHPEQLRAKQKRQREDAEQVRTLLKIFPDAFLFRYIDSDHSLLKLNFRPNPSFHPSSRLAFVFHHMEGTLFLDLQQNRIAEVDGTLASEVKFGAGWLGHLDKGGTFAVKSALVAPNHWDTTQMDIQMRGRVLFFKTISVHDNETYTDYTLVPQNDTLQQIADLLKKECNTVHTASSH